MKRFLSLFLSACLLGSIIAPAYADDLADFKSELAALVAKYETRFRALQDENTQLKAKLAALQNASGAILATVSTGTTISTPVVAPNPIASASWSGVTQNGVYQKVINQINTTLPTILADNGLDGSGAIGLFEFMEPNAFFVSIDDGKNPAGVTAFKTKILFQYDANLNFTKIGLFDLDYTSQKYKTVFGTNPYTKATRTRIQNPLYKGKLFDAVTTSSTTSNVTAPAIDVTFAQIKAAYDKNKVLDALKLSDQYLLKNTADIELLRIRYRSFYIVGKYEDSLAEIKKIETLQGDAFDKTIACDAAVIAKISKNTTANSYYGAICKKK